MTCQKCQNQHAEPIMSWTILRPQKDHAAIKHVGLSESRMSARVAKRIH